MGFDPSHHSSALLPGAYAQQVNFAIDVLGPVTDPQTVHQSKFSMGTVLAIIAVHGRAGLAGFDAHYQDPAVAAGREGPAR